MATFTGKGIKPLYDLETTQSSTSESDTTTLAFPSGDGVYQIRITFTYNSFTTSRAYMGGIKFTDENNNDCTWYSSTVRLLTSAFYHTRYFGIVQGTPPSSTQWAHDPNVWIPHHFGPNTNEALYNHGSLRPAWYDIYVKSDSGDRHMVWGAKNTRYYTTGSGVGYHLDGRLMAVSSSNTRPQKISIIRPYNLYWENLSMQATKILEA